METLAYYNGKIGKIEDISIPIMDRAVYFGDGVYDATMARNHKIFALEEHIERFYRSAELVEIEIGLTKADLRSLLQRLAAEITCPDTFVYWQVSRATGIRQHAFLTNQPSNLLIMLVPEEMADIHETLKLRTEEDIRFEMCHIKTLNLLPNVLASQRAQRADCQETVFHRKGRVTECAHSNIHILTDGKFKTAPTDQYILPGIARAHLIKHCQKLGIPVIEEAFSVTEMKAAEEIIVSSSGSLCSRVVEIDGVEVGGRASGLLGDLQAAVWHEFLTETAEKN